MVRESGPIGPALSGALRGVLDTIPVGVVLLDPEGVPRLVNRAGREVLGDLASTPLARWVEHARIVRPDGTPASREDLPPWSTLVDRKPRREVELIVRRPTGTPTPALFASEAVLDPEGRVLEVACSITPIPDARRRDEAARNGLRMQAIGTLARGLAGPMNDVLTAIQGYCELARSRLDRSDPVHHVVAEIQQAGARATLLTGRLLAHGEREVPTPVVLDLDHWLARHLTTLRCLVGDHIDVDAHPGADGVRVQADPALLEQVISDLVANAREAMDDGGHLSVRTQQVRIDPDLAPLLGAEHAGDYGVISVRDTGTGMDERILPQIFLPFFTTKSGALGLGLSTVERLVRAQGGFVRVESRRGTGTTFHVHLPSVAVPAAVETGPANGGEALHLELDRPIRALLVEDDVVVRELVHEVLEMQHVEVVDANTATDALAFAERDARGFDLLISDVVLPGIGGDALARRLQTSRPGLRVLLMSGCSDAERLTHALEGELTAFLPKPFSPEALLRKIQVVLAPPLAAV